MTKNILKLGYFILLFIAISCTPKIETTQLKIGTWRGEIAMQNKTLPFSFEVLKENNDYRILLENGPEKYTINQVKVQNDSLFFTLHIFDIDIKAKINDTSLEGVYVKNYIDDYELPFKATFNKAGRVDNFQSNLKFDGKWEMTFTDDTGKKIEGIGIFKKQEDKLTGTILTPTGDYRYLEGFTTNTKFTLFSFDGNHAFIFEASLENENNLKGHFWSGKSSYEIFTATKNEHAKLPDANKLTYLKDGYNKVEFSFPDLNGNLVSLTDEKYKNKVLILQIFGTWCPNCMDETKFYSEWYNKNKHRNVEIIGLAFEAKNNFEYAKKRVENMKKRLNVPYNFLIAGTSRKNDASKKLPMLNQVMSFPTSIFIDKKGNVRKIHTGFSGPATGEYYLKFIDEFNLLMDELLNEEL